MGVQRGPTRISHSRARKGDRAQDGTNINGVNLPTFHHSLSHNYYPFAQPCRSPDSQLHLTIYINPSIITQAISECYTLRKARQHQRARNLLIPPSSLMTAPDSKLSTTPTTMDTTRIQRLLLTHCYIKTRAIRI